VHEPRLRERRLDLPHALDVDRGLVPPPGLPRPLGVQAIEGAEHPAGLQGLDRREAALQLLRLEAEVAPLALGDDDLEQAIGGGLTSSARLDQLRDEVGLGRDRELRMGIEHQPQQRRAGAADPDYERGGDPPGAHLLATGSRT
jgi:hypothetical protein